MRPEILAPPTEEFSSDFAALVAMPESENPSLYRRVRELLDRRRLECRKSLACGMAWGEELYDLVDEYRKMHGIIHLTETRIGKVEEESLRKLLKDQPLSVKIKVCLRIALAFCRLVYYLHISKKGIPQHLQTTSVGLNVTRKKNT